jgi:PAS domain S-box-containing protein
MQHPADLLNPARDATSEWDAKPFLQKVTDIVPSVIYIYNQRSQSNEYSNRSIGEALGFSALEVKQMGAEVLGRLCHPDDLSKIAVHFSNIANLRDGAVADIEYRARHKDGHWVWLLSRDAVFQRGPENQVLRHIGVATDITAQKKAEERALSEQLKSQTVNDELRAFSYAMSHDMTSPSHTLQLLLGELVEYHGMSLSADARELAEMALLTAQQLSALVADVKGYTSLIGTQSDLQEVALNAVFTTVLSDLRDGIARSKAQISIANLPVVRGDPAQLRLMFHHLMENAIKFHNPEATPKVSVTYAATADVNKVAITLKDNGVGIATRDQDKMFGIFKRLNPDIDDIGSGLGLAICRRIAANHGDAISVCSQPGTGAAFTVRLPLS